MTDYPQMAKDAAKRRRQLEGALSQAKSSVAACEAELAVLDQILAALKGAGKAAGAVPKRRGRPVGSGKTAKKKRGKWKLGKPGRPPQWYIDQQKAAGGGKKPGRKKRRGRKPGRKPGRKAAAHAAPAPEAAAPAPSL